MLPFPRQDVVDGLDDQDVGRGRPPVHRGAEGGPAEGAGPLRLDLVREPVAVPAVVARRGHEEHVGEAGGQLAHPQALALGQPLSALVDVGVDLQPPVDRPVVGQAQVHHPHLGVLLQEPLEGGQHDLPGGLQAPPVPGDLGGDGHDPGEGVEPVDPEPVPHGRPQDAHDVLAVGSLDRPRLQPSRLGVKYEGLDVGQIGMVVEAVAVVVLEPGVEDARPDDGAAARREVVEVPQLRDPHRFQAPRPGGPGRPPSPGVGLEPLGGVRGAIAHGGVHGQPLPRGRRGQPRLHARTRALALAYGLELELEGRIEPRVLPNVQVKAQVQVRPEAEADAEAEKRNDPD